MNDIWNARRVKLERGVVQATLDLFEHTGSEAFKLPIIQGSSLFVIAGDASAIQNLVTDTATAEESSWPECYGCGGKINPDYGKCKGCEG